MDGLKRRWDELSGLRITLDYAIHCDMCKKAALKENDIRKMREIIDSLDFFKYYQRLAQINEIKNSIDAKIASYYWTGYPKLKGQLWHNWTTLIPILGIPIEKIDEKMIDNCFVQTGILMPGMPVKNRFIVRYKPIVKNGKSIVVGEFTEKEIEPGFVKNLKPYEIVSLHFGNVIEKINIQRSEIIRETIKKSLKRFNAQRK